MSECELKSLFNNISNLKFIKNFSINLENNSLEDSIGSVISQSLVELPKLESININFKGNKLTK